MDALLILGAQGEDRGIELLDCRKIGLTISGFVRLLSLADGDADLAQLGLVSKCHINGAHECRALCRHKVQRLCLGQLLRRAARRLADRAPKKTAPAGAVWTIRGAVACRASDGT